MVEEIYFKEVESIKIFKRNKALRKKMDEIYNFYNRISELSEEEKHRAQVLVRELLENIFKNEFSNTYYIPIEFIESSLGHIIFGLKFGVRENEYTATDVSAIMDITRALVSYDSTNNRLRTFKIGNNTIILESDLISYMESKKMSHEEIYERLNLFRELRLKGVDNEEIKVKIKESISQLYNNK